MTALLRPWREVSIAQQPTSWLQIRDVGARSKDRDFTTHGGCAQLLCLSRLCCALHNNPANDWVVKTRAERLQGPRDYFVTGGMTAAIALVTALKKTNGDTEATKLIRAIITFAVERLRQIRSCLQSTGVAA